MYNFEVNKILKFRFLSIFSVRKKFWYIIASLSLFFLFQVIPIISQDIDSKKSIDLEDIEDPVSIKKTKTPTGKEGDTNESSYGNKYKLPDGEKIEVEDKTIKGKDESEISSTMESEMDVNPDLAKDYTAHRLENLDKIKAKDSDSRRGKNRSAYVKAGFGNYNSFLLDFYLAKTDDIGKRAGKRRSKKRSSYDIDEKLIKGKRIALEGDNDYAGKSYYYQKQISYLVQYNRRNQDSMSYLDKNLANSAFSLDDFTFIAGLAALPGYRQKLSFHYFHKKLGLQNNSFYTDSDVKAFKTSLENSYRWNSRQMLKFYGVYKKHDFLFRKDTYNFHEENHNQFTLGGSFKGGLSKSHFLTILGRLQYNDARSSFPDSVNQGLAQNIVKDNQVIIYGHFQAYDTYTAINNKNTGFLGKYKLQFLFGLDASGAAQMSGAIGPYLGIKQILNRVLFWDLLYKRQAILISPSDYIDYDYSLPGWKRQPWTEHNIINNFALKLNKSIQFYFDTTFHFAENYPNWQENNRQLYTLSGKNIDFMEWSPYLKWKLSKLSVLKAGLKGFYVLSGVLPNYISTIVPYLKLEMELLKIKNSLSISYYSEQNTGIAAARISNFAIVDVAMERKVYASLHVFLEAKNLANQKIRKRRLYREEGLKINGGCRILF